MSVSLDLPSLARRYRTGAAGPAGVVEEVLARIEARGDDHVWITLRPAAALLADAETLRRRWPDPAARPPLYGVPFAVKDNVDVAGLPTTAACPAYAYVPERGAPLVERLLAAGALLVGKTNLDQFATGLSGTRSPYGACESPLVPGLISGGSSSGSAVAVAAGLVAFAVGTDTAGSGRVPAALTGTVGIKPSRGLVSTLGVVPACASLDCASVFAGSVADGLAVLSVMAGPQDGDPWSRRLPVPAPVPPAVGPRRIGVPARPEFFGDDAAAAAFEEVKERLAGLGHRLVPVDLEPFLAAGRLLYDGPWLAERLAAVGDFADRHPEELHPVTLRVLRRGGALSAVDAYRGLYRLRELRARTEHAWAAMDALALPTVPTTFTVAEMAEEPIERNTVLGHYTTFTNLLDLAGVAVPGGLTSAGRPHGLTLLGPAGSDELLAGLAAPFHALTGGPPAQPGPAPAPATPPASPPQDAPDAPAVPTMPAAPAAEMVLAVVGAHRTGQPLHGQLTSLGAVPLGTAPTAPLYRLYALDGGEVPRAGLVRSATGGFSVEVELFGMDRAALGALLAAVGPPLGVGTVLLADGRSVHGFLCESYAAASALDISAHGSWPGYLLSLA
ncbi:allophanate hydrolase [Sphaerisporangium sp. TRM90804]|uniref:allophanate hydrolase n=1 Tax=Sphaerisporangium sp. TRM90804 TaxID=3031113 RepID=UPI0024482448|nr:allophanate hydrolase [Sphaerisporangium sp. TRM90804]MDH2429081.1 allophanate hydrolase [Sphaerisporangium sp. TRM90804]